MIGEAKKYRAAAKDQLDLHRISTFLAVSIYSYASDYFHGAFPRGGLIFFRAKASNSALKYYKNKPDCSENNFAL